MSALALLFLIAGLGLIGWLTARVRAVSFRRESTARFSSLPSHHGTYVAMWTILPAALFLAVWSSVSPALVTDAVLEVPAAAQLPANKFERASILSEARNLAAGRSFGTFNPLSQTLAPAYASTQKRYDWIGSAAALLLAFATGAWAFTRVRPAFRARTQIERVVMVLLLGASLIALEPAGHVRQ
jgi:phosphate transport system permease protein